MADNFGLKIGLEGEKEFKKAIADINQSFKVLGSEMKLVSSEFSKNDTSMQAVAARSEVLNKQIDAQKQKIEVLRQALKNASESFEENDRRTQSWQIQLNNAEAALNDMERELKANNDALSEASDGYTDAEKSVSKMSDEMDDAAKNAGDMGGQIDDAGEKAEKSGSKFEKLGSVLKGIGTAMGAVAAAVKLGKEVISAYADYEQLVGGVDTLFKDNSKELQSYAANAYKTAGLSANEYMETVTSFSASLIQSLGGDTEKAVKYADMAITDMSDNANKMGTDMSMIQSAYQGFAKQNYTMLDNLKLGYGGTKEEMQRLIDDANALNAAQGNYTNYSIESYADIVDAIHTVQTEMGITGTTAKEASTTIEGSIGAMKAAYANFVTGLGNDNADISELSSQLIQSVGTVAENVLPVVETVLKNIAEAVQRDGPEMIEKFVSYAIEKLPEVISLGLQMVISLVKGIAQNIPQLVTSVLNMMATIVQTIWDSLPDIIEVGKNIVRGLWGGIKSMASWIGDKVSSFVGGIVDGVKGVLGIHSPSRVFAGIGQNMALGLGQGFERQMQSVTAGIQDAIPTPTVDTVYNAAAGLVNGLAAQSAGSPGGSYTIKLVLQNGQQIASWLLPDLRDAARSNPEVATA